MTFDDPIFAWIFESHLNYRMPHIRCDSHPTAPARPCQMQKHKMNEMVKNDMCIQLCKDISLHKILCIKSSLTVCECEAHM